MYVGLAWILLEVTFQSGHYDVAFGVIVAVVVDGGDVVLGYTVQLFDGLELKRSLSWSMLPPRGQSSYCDEQIHLWRPAPTVRTASTLDCGCKAQKKMCGAQNLLQTSHMYLMLLLLQLIIMMIMIICRQVIFVLVGCHSRRGTPRLPSQQMKHNGSVVSA